MTTNQHQQRTNTHRKTNIALVIAAILTIATFIALDNYLTQQQYKTCLLIKGHETKCEELKQP